MWGNLFIRQSNLRRTRSLDKCEKTYKKNVFSVESFGLFYASQHMVLRVTTYGFSCLQHVVYDHPAALLEGRA